MTRSEHACAPGALAVAPVAPAAAAALLSVAVLDSDDEVADAAAVLLPRPFTVTGCVMSNRMRRRRDDVRDTANVCGALAPMEVAMAALSDVTRADFADELREEVPTSDKVVVTGRSFTVTSTSDASTPDRQMADRQIGGCRDAQVCAATLRSATTSHSSTRRVTTSSPRS